WTPSCIRSVVTSTFSIFSTGAAIAAASSPIPIIMPLSPCCAGALNLLLISSRSLNSPIRRSCMCNLCTLCVAKRLHLFYRLSGTFQGMFQYIVHSFNKHKCHPVFNILWKVIEVFLVSVRNYDGLYPHPFGCKVLFLESSNWKHPHPQRNFAGHCDILSYGSSGQCRCN